MEFSTCATEYHDGRCCIFLRHPEPVKKVATSGTAAQVVIQKHQGRPRMKLGLGGVAGMEIRHSRIKTIRLMQRKRGLSERDCFPHQKPVSCAIVDMQQWNGRVHRGQNRTVSALPRADLLGSVRNPSAVSKSEPRVLRPQCLWGMGLIGVSGRGQIRLRGVLTPFVPDQLAG